VSPFELWSLTLHGAFAFAAIFIYGLLWGVHIPVRWLRGKRRVTGGLLAGVLGWLILGGYLLYYAGGEEFRAAVSVAHWIVGLAAPLGFLAHWLKRRGTLPAASATRDAATGPRSPRDVSAASYARDLIGRSAAVRLNRAEIARAGED
jgi:hypothetical protein